MLFYTCDVVVLSLRNIGRNRAYKQHIIFKSNRDIMLYDDIMYVPSNRYMKENNRDI